MLGDSTSPKSACDTASAPTGGTTGTSPPDDSGPARLLLVFDRAMVRDGVRALVTADRSVQVIGEASGQLDDVERAVRRLHPDVVLVDQQLTGQDGIATATGLLRRMPDDAPGIVILAGSARDCDFRRAARAGIRGYLVEQDDSMHIVSGVKAVAAGEAWLSARAARKLLDDYRARSTLSDNSPGSDPDSLTQRERGVVELIARGRSNAEIAEELVLGETTVKTHVSRILTKLKLRDRTQLAAFAYRNGLASDGDAARSRAR
jgi:DNA-binding NarL/FixJ family response regulator